MQKIFSFTLNWSLRLIAIFVILTTIGLLAVNTLSGTSGSQKEGLEQAFSDALQMNVTIKRLNKFNIIPQFSIDMSNFTAQSSDGKSSIKADNITIAFSALDLIREKKTIEDFAIRNGELNAPQISKTIFKNIDIKILVPELATPARAIMTGQANGKDISLSMTMHHKLNNMRYSYFLNDSEAITATYKKCTISGTYNLNNQNKVTWNQIDNKNKDCKILSELFISP